MVQRTVKRSGNSKIKFIMLEADLNDGNLSEITQAISGALRQSSYPQHLISAPVRAESETAAKTVEEEEQQEEVFEEPEEVEAPRASKPRKPTIPKILDVDLKGGEMPFEDFATRKSPNSDLKRHLAVAFWFKKYRNTQPVTANHAFTCYKLAGWPTTIADFSQPFRDLSRASKGDFKAKGFTINQFGEDTVENMGSE